MKQLTISLIIRFVIAGILATPIPLYSIRSANTENGIFSEDLLIVTLGPEVQFFAPVPNLIGPEEYLLSLGAKIEKRDEKSWRVSPSSDSSLAELFQKIQNVDPYTVNPPFASVELNLIAYIQEFAPPDKLSRLWNYSNRAEVKQGQSIAVGGLVLPGNHPKIVILRGLGPSLADYGIDSPLEDPELRLTRIRQDKGATEILKNDDWGNHYIGTEMLLSLMGIDFPSRENEALLATILDPGMYTAQLSSADSSAGIALLEYYILDDVVVVPLD